VPANENEELRRKELELKERELNIREKELSQKEGFIEEREAKLLFYQFLRNNVTFTTDLITGVKLFPFQHMAVKSMLESDYFLGVWSRGMSKSYTTGIFAVLDAILNQGVEIGILSRSFRQSKMTPPLKVERHFLRQRYRQHLQVFYRRELVIFSFNDFFSADRPTLS
jgi:hypothetical protein